MLNSEYKVLKYIYRHPDVSFKKLKKKFSKLNLSIVLRRQGHYLEWTKLEETQDKNGAYTGNYQFSDDSIFYVSYSGEEYIEKKQHDFWTFFFPYAITTLIAISSVIIDLLNFFCN